MTIKTDTGGDPTKAITEELRSTSKETLRDAMNIWHTSAIDRLTEAAEQRAGGGGADDSEGRHGREHNNLHAITQSFQPPHWDESENAWVFSVTHAAAIFHEFGATPHEIRARMARALAFEWPDAPKEVEEKFEKTFPTVFFNSVRHPGVPAVGYLRHGRTVARRRLEAAGYDVTTFGGQTNE